jgi:hypothetical protein
VIRVFPKLTGTNSPELGPTDVAEADSVQGSERRRYNVTTPVIGIYLWILYSLHPLFALVKGWEAIREYKGTVKTGETI